MEHTLKQGFLITLIISLSLLLMYSVVAQPTPPPVPGSLNEPPALGGLPTEPPSLDGEPGEPSALGDNTDGVTDDSGGDDGTGNDGGTETDGGTDDYGDGSTGDGSNRGGGHRRSGGRYLLNRTQEDNESQSNITRKVYAKKNQLEEMGVVPPTPPQQPSQPKITQPFEQPQSNWILYITIIAGAVAIVLAAIFLWYYFSQREKAPVKTGAEQAVVFPTIELNEEKGIEEKLGLEEQPAEISPDYQQTLMSFIKDALKRGYDKGAIRQALSKKGWDLSRVDPVLSRM